MSDSTIGHNRLRSFVQRVERLREEIDALNTDVSEVYKEAKGEGWNVHAMKALISERAKHAKNPDKFRELNDFVELYRNALAGGTPYATRVHAERNSHREPATLSPRAPIPDGADSPPAPAPSGPIYPPAVSVDPAAGGKGDADIPVTASPRPIHDIAEGP